MTRRDFRTPPLLPIGTQTRCITIPASQPWLGLVNAALLMLTEAWRYDQVEPTDMTAEETAAYAYSMYVDYLGVCSEMAVCCPMRINPFTGRLQQSADDGLTWFDIADGPWTESLYPEFSAIPRPRPEANDKLCAASATAAYVLRNLYTQTGNTLLQVVADTDWEYAGALGAMLSGFLMMIGAIAVQPFVAIASLLGIVGVRQQYVDNPLDEDDEERMTCLLLENATLEPSGAVTFDFNGFYGAIDLDSPKNGLVRFLLTMIGPDALNYSGAIDAGITTDCSVCVEVNPCDGNWYTQHIMWNSPLWTPQPPPGGTIVIAGGTRRIDTVTSTIDLGQSKWVSQLSGPSIYKPGNPPSARLTDYEVQVDGVQFWRGNPGGTTLQGDVTFNTGVVTALYGRYITLINHVGIAYIGNSMHIRVCDAG